MEINGKYLTSDPFFNEISSIERRIFLQLTNAINDLNFDEFKSRGSSYIYSFEDHVMGYSLSFGGNFKLKLIFNITDERYYFSYQDELFKDKIIDVFMLKTWNDIDDWIGGKEFHYNNETGNALPIETDKLYLKYSEDKEE